MPTIIHLNPHIDVETFSSYNLFKCGLRRYVESPDFEIQLVSFQFHGQQQVYTYDLTNGEKLPEQFVSLLKDNNVIKIAHNAAFERWAFSIYLNTYLSPDGWFDTMAQTAYFGLPLKLENAAEALQISDQKLKTGKDLINKFAKPCKPTKNNGYSTRNYPIDFPTEWSEYKTYNAGDVKAESGIYKALSSYKFPASEWEIYKLDQRINDRGIKIDVPFANKAFQLDQEYKAEIFATMQDLTGLDNPNSRNKVLDWLEQNAIDVVADDLKKGTVDTLLRSTKDQLTTDVLEGWKDLAKKATSKYEAMLMCVNNDSRARGLFQYYGANRTGRWAGRLIQLQNLTQPTIGKNIHNDEDMARLYLQAKRDVMDMDLSTLKMFYSDISGLLSSLIRPTFIPEKGKVFYVVDFSAIEARVLAWLANEQWRLDVFSTTGKIYEASAARLFRVPESAVTKDSDYRKKGKVAELAFGYQGGVNAFNQMAGRDANKYSEEEKDYMVKQWRIENPAIRSFWDDMNNAAIMSVYNPGKVVDAPKGIQFYTDNNFMQMRLLSGRSLYYYKARIGTGKFGGPCVEYLGTDGGKRTMKWTQTYGGKLTENLTQATARDLLAESMLRLDKNGYPIVMHVHDENTVEFWDRNADRHLDIITEIMIQLPPWATGLPMAADGFVSEFYRK